MNVCIVLFSVLSFVVVVSFKVVAVHEWLRRPQFIRPLLLLGIGFFIADIVYLLPVKCLTEAVMTAAQMVTLNADYAELLPKDCLIRRCWCFCLCIMTPIVWGSVALSLLVNFIGWSYYNITHVSVYFFSQLNNNSLTLAKDIKNSGEKCLCIFCGVGANADPELKVEAQEYGCLCFEKSETSWAHIRNPKRRQTFFEISDNQDENLAHGCELIDKYTERFGNADYSAIKIFIFSEQEEAPLILSSKDKKGIAAVIVDRCRFCVNDLMFRHPLYQVLNDKITTISVLIVGTHRMGMELIKTIIWCGQLGSDYHLKITVIDQNANHCKSILQQNCPELFSNEYQITFIETDPFAAEFTSTLDEYCSDCNYVCVCFDNDEQNILSALYLRTYYSRRNISENMSPFIAVMIRDSTKNIVFASEQNSCHLTPFGGDNLLYSSAILISPLEDLAMNVHQIYLKDKNLSETDIRRDYYKDENNIKSCRANALHIPYKLFALGYQMLPVNSDDNQNEDTVSFNLSETDELKWARIEHDRWNAYTRSEGWCVLTDEQIETAGLQHKKNKIPQAKLHACLRTWDGLDDLIKLYGTDYKQYDIDFIQNIPQIMGVSGALPNITRIHYKLQSRLLHEVK